jgi:hypothetical protein
MLATKDKVYQKIKLVIRTIDHAAKIGRSMTLSSLHSNNKKEFIKKRREITRYRNKYCGGEEL